LNTDATKYGGSGVVNEVVQSEHLADRGFEQSALVRIPPLGTVWFAPLAS